MARGGKVFPTGRHYDPSNLGAKNNLALALVEQEDPTKKAKALAYADENTAPITAPNNNPDVLSTLVWVCFRCNHHRPPGRMALDGAIKALGGNVLANPDTATYVAHVLYHKDQKYQAKQILENVLKNERPFSMKKEAQALYEKVKDTPAPAKHSGGTGVYYQSPRSNQLGFALSAKWNLAGRS